MQNLHFKKHEPTEVTSEQLKERESKVCVMYLGDGDTAEWQVCCSETGAKLLRFAPHIHYDASFKHTPKISSHSQSPMPCKDALHLISVFDPHESTQTPMAVPCATISSKMRNMLLILMIKE